MIILGLIFIIGSGPIKNYDIDTKTMPIKIAFDLFTEMRDIVNAPILYANETADI